MGQIRLENLRKEFGPKVAVKDTNLEVHEGEFLVFVGPSGCGKTTTLRMIAGLEEPSSGDVYIDGSRATDVEPGRRNLGMVFQNLALFPHKTVFGNIAFGLRVKKLPADVIRKKVEEVASLVHIHEHLDKLPGKLSGGEAQRVALARTLVTEPTAFLLDEPLSNLDAQLRKEMRVEIDRLHSELRKTFVYVTHDQEEAMTLADRIVVMRDGDIEQVGGALDLYHNPVNRFVAGFFGSPTMNHLEGELHDESGRGVFACPGLRLTLGNLRAQYRGRITVGVRPEQVRVKPSGGAHRAKVALLEPLGKDTLLYLDYGGSRLLTSVVEGGSEIAEKDSVTFDLSPNHIYLFDPQGARVDRKQ
ncbi:MAG: ABC transporter ATP-binding protein [Nitrospinota bacterium]